MPNPGIAKLFRNRGSGCRASFALGAVRFGWAAWRRECSRNRSLPIPRTGLRNWTGLGTLPRQEPRA